MMLHNIWHNVPCYHSPPFHTSSYLHFTLPHIIPLTNIILPSTRWSTKCPLSHTKFYVHFPSPNHLSKQAVCTMKLLSCNTLCMHLSLHSTHYTVLSSCCPFECCSGWPLHLQSYQPSRIRRWPHLRYVCRHYCESKYEPRENHVTQQTDCHPNLGKIFLLCWSIIIKYSACVWLVFDRDCHPVILCHFVTSDCPSNKKTFLQWGQNRWGGCLFAPGSWWWTAKGVSNPLHQSLY